MERIRIGLFIDTFYPMVDGVIGVVDNYARRLGKYADVTVFAPEFHGQKYDDSRLPYEVVRCKSIDVPTIDYSLPVPRLDLNYMAHFRRRKLDIVHIHSPFTLGAVGIEYAKKHGIPVVATLHSQFRRDIMRAAKSDVVTDQLLRLIIRRFDRCDECWAVNDEVGRVFHEDYGLRDLPRVMNNATDLLPVADQTEPGRFFREKYGIPEDQTVFLFVGRLNNLKNVFFLVNSLRRYKEKYDGDFRMLFVGTGQDEAELRRRTTENGLDEQVIFCGRVMDRREIALYYARADLFLFPSLYDSSSLVQIEAASQGTPSLFLRGAVTAATVEDNVTGFLAQENEGAYAEKIHSILSDRALYESVSAAAKEKLYVTWDEQVEKAYRQYLACIIRRSEKHS